MRGRFITFEGGEGCGKSTQAKLLCDYLSNQGYKTVLTREPGGVPEGEELRKILKNPNYNLTNLSQLYLFSASRNLFVERVVRPNLEKGVKVISDRFMDSTIAYQGYAGRGNIEKIKEIIRESIGDVYPDLTFIIDLDPRKGLEKEVEDSSFSRLGLDYHNKVREGFLEVARNEPDRCKVINYKENSIDEMHREIVGYVLEKFLITPRESKILRESSNIGLNS